MNANQIYRYGYYSAFSVLLVMICSMQVGAQTCSCAGAPLVSSQAGGMINPGNYSVGITYQYNDISAIYSGSTKQNQRTQERSTESYLLEISAGIINRLSATLSLSYVDKNRTTGLSTPVSSTATVNGIGDGLISLNYELIESDLWNPNQVIVFGGVKVPFGEHSVSNNGVQFNADMQPGTGTFDVLSGVIATHILRSWNAEVQLGIRYRANGENERFNSDDNYSFGNRLTVQGAFRKQVNTFIAALGLEYRKAASDQLNSNKLANTGGSWLFVQPSVSAGLFRNTGIRVSADLPIFTEVQGTQPSTSFALMASFFVNFGKSESKFKRL
jgi:hypothetical protein